MESFSGESFSLSYWDYFNFILLRPIAAILFTVSLLLFGWFLAWKLVLVHVPLVQEIFGLRKKTVKPKPPRRRILTQFYNSIDAQNPSSEWASMSNVPSTTGAASSSSGQYTYSAATTPYFPTPFHLQQAPPQPPVPYIGAAPPPAAPLPVYPAPPTVYTLPQYQQAQQLFQRDAQTITPEALESVKAALASSDIEHKAETKKKAIPRKAAGQTWEDPTLAEWPENDYRLFCGDLGNEVNDDVLSKAFARFPSFNMARVVRDKRTGKTKGYGFISFANPTDLVGALKEMNGKYVGNRPIKLRKSTWTERTDTDAMGRQKHHFQKKTKLPKKSILHK